jgi:cyclopropane-fatty-acyl-phospholipid synthase
MPRVRPRRAVRWAGLAALRALWASDDERLDLVMPSGECVRLGGPGQTAATMQIHDDRFFLRLLLRGEMGAGEAFVAGDWSAADDDALVDVLRVFVRGTRSRGVESPLTRFAQLPALLRHRRAANTLGGSRRNIGAHYDLGNDFYRLFLDEDTLAYSCGLYPAASLADAQRAKLDRLCDWLALTPDDHLLEIGCGWGGLAIHAARTRGCRVTAITISQEQYVYATAAVAAANLSHRIAIELRDYRTLAGTFDKIASVEMLEAVGYDYLPDYFQICARLLRPGGTLALQSITMPDARFASYRKRVDWMQTYIFPGSLIPSLPAIERAAGPAGFHITHADDIGPHYAPTLRAWRRAFVAALPQIPKRFDEPFIRTWLLYLAFSEAAFAERALHDHQLLLTCCA